MQILTVDVGTGTQDILLFDSERTPENCLKLVVPSPTLLLSRQVQAGHGCAPAAPDYRRADGRRPGFLGRRSPPPRGPAHLRNPHRRPHLQRRPRRGPAPTSASSSSTKARRAGLLSQGQPRARRVPRFRLRGDSRRLRRSSASTCARTRSPWPSSTTAQPRRTSATASSAWTTWRTACARPPSERPCVPRRLRPRRHDPAGCAGRRPRRKPPACRSW